MIKRPPPKSGRKRIVGFTNVTIPNLPDLPAGKDKAVLSAISRVEAMTVSHRSLTLTADAILASLNMLIKVRGYQNKTTKVFHILFYLQNPPEAIYKGKVKEFYSLYFLSLFLSDIADGEFSDETIIHYAHFLRLRMKNIFSQTPSEIMARVFRESLGVHINSEMAKDNRRDVRIKRGIYKNFRKFAPVISCSICDADLSNPNEIENKCRRICSRLIDDF
jgi:hypothetical protein